MSSHHLLILGATGMVGGHALDLALADDRVDRVTVLGRRTAGRTHGKLAELLLPDLSDLSALTHESGQLAGIDAVLFCVGAYTGTLPDDAFKAVTVDLPLNVGQAVLAQSPGAAFVLLSGQGADRTETSRVAFARFKGMAENALDQMDFARFHSFRPGYIYPVTPRQEPNFTYRLARLLYPALRAIYPNVGLPAPDLAWAMVEGAIAGTPGGAVVLENADIRAFAAARSAST